MLVHYLNNASESGWLNLMYRLDLSKNEEELLAENVLATLTSEEKLKIIRKLISRVQENFFYLAENGQLGTSEFLQLENLERQKILENIKFTDEEIDLLSYYPFNEMAVSKNPLFSSIQWKSSGWQEVGFVIRAARAERRGAIEDSFTKIKSRKKLSKT